MEHALSLPRNNRAAEKPVANKRERFEAIARANQGLLLRVAGKLTNGNEAWAQDIVQDTLVNAYRAYCDGAFEDGTNARAWLVKIATNVFLNDNRRRQRWEAGLALEEDVSEPVAPVTERPDVQLLSEVYDGPLELALASLPEHQRIVVALVDAEQMDYAEAAEALGVPVGTIRSRLARARIALYEQLRAYAKERGALR